MTAMALEPGVAGWMQWEDQVMCDPGLIEKARQECRKGGADIRLTAIAIGKAGRFGRGCFAKAETVGGKIGVHRNTVEKHRKYLIEQGWFTVVSRKGGSTGRAVIVDISLPVVPVLTEDGRFMRCPKHGNFALAFGECPDCRFALVRAG
jgi:hypothetical protein